MPVAKELGVSPTAIVGAVANEYDTRKKFNVGKQAIADGFANIWSFEHLQSRKMKPSGGTPGIGYKIMSPRKIDVGPGNIRVDAAISMVQDYVKRYEGTKMDPLGLLKYRNDYNGLVDDLLNFENSRASYAIAGLFLAKGQKLLKRKSLQAWERLSPDQKDALLVTYYKIGEERIKRNIDKRLNPSNRSPESFAYNPRGDGSQQHLNNAENLKKWLKLPRLDYPVSSVGSERKIPNLSR
ncbi:hypothetical protein [Nitratireductor sp. XY-223]|uniref:hypothetical protein n=1 Tax=Nitratireductor sp. XY-223 TaxID=2561926 RepID=UPI0010AA52CA|nr:hypothetical protein [Nitratireductor sp. XY-223]